MKKKLLKWTKWILLIYGLLGIAIYYFQDYFLFRPESKPINEPYSFSSPHKEINIKYDSGLNINIVQFYCDSPARGVVLYFHGNMKNIGHYAHFAPNFTNNHYEVWMLDYPGYGKSTGTITEDILYEYALLVYEIAKKKFPKDSIILYGKSLGSGVAAFLGSKKDCKRLILETPYYSITSLAAHYFPIYPVRKMLHYKLPCYEYVHKIIAPISIFHGNSDWIIPYSNSIRLKEVLKSSDEYITIENGSHNNLNDSPFFRQKFDSLLLQ